MNAAATPRVENAPRHSAESLLTPSDDQVPLLPGSGPHGRGQYLTGLTPFKTGVLPRSKNSAAARRAPVWCLAGRPPRRPLGSRAGFSLLGGGRSRRGVPWASRRRTPARRSLAFAWRSRGGPQVRSRLCRQEHRRASRNCRDFPAKMGNVHAFALPLHRVHLAAGVWRPRSTPMAENFEQSAARYAGATHRINGTSGASSTGTYRGFPRCSYGKPLSSRRRLGIAWSDRRITSTHGAKGTGGPDRGRGHANSPHGMDAQPGADDAAIKLPDQGPLHRLLLGRAALHAAPVDGDLAEQRRLAVVGVNRHRRRAHFRIFNPVTQSRV